MKNMNKSLGQAFFRRRTDKSRMIGLYHTQKFVFFYHTMTQATEKRILSQPQSAGQGPPPANLLPAAHDVTGVVIFTYPHPPKTIIIPL
jgi:hypothetical protein